MKNIIFLLFSLLFFNSAFCQEYEDLFLKMDSIAEKSPASYAFRIFSMLNYEYNHSSEIVVKDKTEIIATFKLNNENKFEIVFIDNNNKDLESSINNWLKKAPQLPIKKFDKKFPKLEFISVKFDLKKTDYKAFTFEDIIKRKNENTDNSKSLIELDLYPSFGKQKKKYSNKEDALKNLNKAIEKMIVKNFTYPPFAAERNIQGKTLINFIINKEGEIRTMVSCYSHPVLQLQGISIVSKFSKFNPGKKDGENVNVRYSLPLTFRLQ